MLRSSRKLIRLTDALLLLASEDAGALTVSGEPVDLSDLVEEALDRWRKRAADMGVRLDGPGAPAGGLVAGDEVLLGRVLDNLLENAIRHAGSGGTSDSTSGARRRTAGRWSSATAARASTAAFRAHAFERFTRAEKHRSRDGGGAGLGLPLCAAIASAHGGSVNIDPSVTGARLRVWLPATRPSGRVQHRQSA